MNRRATAARYRREKNARKHARDMIEKTLTDMEDAWATVTFVEGAGFEIADLHETKEDATEVAQAGTSRAMDDATHLVSQPYTVVFAVPVLSEKGYARGTPYFANLRAARGAGGEARAVSLWATAEGAEAEAVATAGEDAANQFTRIGGPVVLTKKTSTAAPAAPAPTKSERRAARLAEKRANRKRPGARPA